MCRGITKDIKRRNSRTKYLESLLKVSLIAEISLQSRAVALTMWLAPFLLRAEAGSCGRLARRGTEEEAVLASLHQAATRVSSALLG